MHANDPETIYLAYMGIEPRPGWWPFQAQHALC